MLRHPWQEPSWDPAISEAPSSPTARPDAGGDVPSPGKSLIVTHEEFHPVSEISLVVPSSTLCNFGMNAVSYLSLTPHCERQAAALGLLFL